MSSQKLEKIQAVIDFFENLHILEEYVKEVASEKLVEPVIVVDGGKELFLYEADGIPRIRVVEDTKTISFELYNDSLAKATIWTLKTLKKELQKIIDTKISILQKHYKRYDRDIENILSNQVGNEAVLSHEVEKLEQLVSAINELHSEIDRLVEIVYLIDELIEKLEEVF